MKKALAFLSLSLLILLSACNGESIEADSVGKNVDYLWVPSKLNLKIILKTLLMN